MVMVYDEETGKNHPREVEEDHITVTWEGLGLGKYLFHFTPDKPKGKEKPAEMISKGIYSRFEEFGAIEDFLLIRRDSTYTNTGPEGGAIHYLKKLLDHKVHWLICLIHIDELLLKHMMMVSIYRNRGGQDQ